MKRFRIVTSAGYEGVLVKEELVEENGGMPPLRWLVLARRHPTEYGAIIVGADDVRAEMLPACCILWEGDGPVGRLYTVWCVKIGGVDIVGRELLPWRELVRAAQAGDAEARRTVDAWETVYAHSRLF